MSPTVAAVVPTFRPDGADLLSVVAGLMRESIPCLVVDDASPCTFDRALASVAAEGVEVVRHQRNRGIARSLNEGLRFAARLGAEWLLTVDQDSSLPPGHAAALMEAVGMAEGVLGEGQVGAVAAGMISDASGALGYPTVMHEGLPFTEEVIQTGTLWRVEALCAAGGFDERLGIDAVDAAACLALRSTGRLILLVPDRSLGHRLGNAAQITILGRAVVSSGHSPERRETIIRNRLRLFPAEFRQSPRHAIRTLRRTAVATALAVSIEDDRWAKARGALRGLRPSSTKG